MSACALHEGRLSSYPSSTSWRRPISSRDRKRVSLGRGFFFTPRVGLVSMCPREIAWFMICRNTSNAEFAPPGAVALYPSNHRITPVLSIPSSGMAPKTGSS